MKTVADVMTNMPIVVQVPGNRNDAINIMVRNKLTGLPVVRASDGQLMGIISRRDVFKNMKETQLSILMKKNPLVISPDATLAEAAKIFFEKRIHRLPVVENQRLIGIITPTDLIREIKKMKNISITAEEAIRVSCATPLLFWSYKPMPKSCSPSRLIYCRSHSHRV